ncbi:hypothetical protein ACUY1T_12790 [Billgrantia sp. Q4P2]|uniref:hypothetical protein n=1 Tax=Billgrantia sp. Q4P2 TaxID=3463857 RepID=UPI00405688D7
MEALLNSRSEVTEAALAAIAHMPTASLPVLMDEAFAQRLTNADFMRIAVLLAQTSAIVRPELDLEDWKGVRATHEP